MPSDRPGSLLDFPFDTYKFALNMYAFNASASGSGSGVPYRIKLKVSNANCGAFSVAIERRDAVFDGSTTPLPTIGVTLTRPGLSLLFPVLVTISFVGIFFSEVWIIWMFYLSGMYQYLKRIGANRSVKHLRVNI